MSKIEITDELLYEVVPIYEMIFLNQIPPNDEIDHVFSDRFNKKMDRLIKLSKKPKVIRKVMMFSHKKIAVASVVIVVASVTSMSMLSVQGNRTRFFDVITQMYKELTTITFDSDDQKNYDKLVPNVPTYIPDGFKEIDRFVSKAKVRITYENNEGVIIKFIQNYVNDNSAITDTEDIKIEVSLKNGGKSYFIKNKDYSQLVWSDNVYNYKIVSEIDYEELVKMADSIRQISNEKNN